VTTSRVAVVVLAAGYSARMPGTNKLTLEVDGVALIARVVDAALASTATDVVVVTGSEAEAVSSALGARAVRIVHNPSYATGMGTTIAAGVAALPEDTTCALICLGDLPRLRADHFDAVIRAFDPPQGQTICIPVHDGQRGHPVLFGAHHFDALRALSADMGARHILESHAEIVCEVEVDDAAIIQDIDTPEDWAALEATCDPRKTPGN
jgi:molybdenum cofactor cytidylyltransferase